MVKVSGTVVKAVGGLYTVAEGPQTGCHQEDRQQEDCRQEDRPKEVQDAEPRLHMAKPRGIFRKNKLRLLPGDRVSLVESGDPDCPYSIYAVEARKNIMIRPPVVNLDSIIIVVALTDPAPDWYFVDKMLIIAAVNGLKAIIYFSKSDLFYRLPVAEQAATQREIEAYQAAGFTCVISATEDKVADESAYENGRAGGYESSCRDKLFPFIAGRMVALSGQSGVGKSTLINKLLDAEKMSTGKVSSKLGRGRHTTRHVEFFPCLNGYIADTPGFSSLDLAEIGVEENQILPAYPELHSNEICRFAGCRHLNEPGCEVLRLVTETPMLKARYDRYSFFRRLLLSRKTAYGKDHLRPRL